MENYGLVSSDPSWTWIVEKQCYVSWSDNEEDLKELGETSPRNCTSRLTLNIGRRPESDELLIALHLPILERGKKNARDMFMIIPNTFDKSQLDKTFPSVQKPGRAKLNSAGFAYCNLFHIPVTVAEPCTVIMPQRKRQKSMEGTAHVLVSKLKSLSESLSFDIYTRFDTFAQVQLRKAFTEIDQLNMPSLLLESMYNGCGGRVNEWQYQGLNLEPQSTRNSFNPEAPQRASPQPPPYTRDNITSLDSNASQPPEPLREFQVPFSDADVAPISMHKDSDGEGIPETPFYARMQRILDYRSPDINYRREDCSKRAAIVDLLPDARRVKQIRARHSPLIRPSKREASAPVIVGASTAVGPDDVAVATGHGVTSPTGPSADKLEENSWQLFASTPASLSIDRDAEKTVAVHRDASLPFDKAEEIARWLHGAWNVLPDAHHVLRSELLALGAAEDASCFAELRIDCSTNLAFATARITKQTLVEAATDASEVQQVREVVQWVNGVKSGTDIALLHDLVTLAGAAIDVADCVFQEKRQNQQRFSVLKARCIASACVL
ncbi:hypothetical protein M436DRAFT_73233 [Aureobasidium namibiae CBS 147.97]|uniref:Uncharacterized protein n=1 Tax=Aureobasidium namibiae CBS 147.97 TaxID=1043004 RepID=A0A074WJC1_9PEZI